MDFRLKCFSINLFIAQEMKFTLLVMFNILTLFFIAIHFATTSDDECEVILSGYINSLRGSQRVEVKRMTCYNVEHFGFYLRSVDFSGCYFGEVVCLSWFSDSTCSIKVEQTSCRAYDDNLISISRSIYEGRSKIRAIMIWWLLKAYLRE